MPRGITVRRARKRGRALSRRAVAHVLRSGQRVVVATGGRPSSQVGIVPPEDVALLDELEDRADLAEAEDSLEAARTEGVTSWADTKARHGL